MFAIKMSGWQKRCSVYGLERLITESSKNTTVECFYCWKAAVHTKSIKPWRFLFKWKWNFFFLTPREIADFWYRDNHNRFSMDKLQASSLRTWSRLLWGWCKWNLRGWYSNCFVMVERRLEWCGRENHL